MYYSDDIKQFEILTAVRIFFFWDVTSCNLVDTTPKKGRYPGAYTKLYGVTPYIVISYSVQHAPSETARMFDVTTACTRLSKPLCQLALDSEHHHCYDSLH